jgi:hypothetical protein
METDTQTQNGNGNKFSLPTFGCKGCEDRKQIMGADNWQIDVAILLLIAIGAVVLWKVKIT